MLENSDESDPLARQDKRLQAASHASVAITERVGS